MNDSLEKRDEQVNDALYKLRQLGQKWNGRPTLGNLRLSERYRVGEFEIIVHMQRRTVVPGHAQELCAVLSNRNASECRGWIGLGSIGKEVSQCFPESGKLVEHGVSVSMDDTDKPAPDDVKEAVFVEIIQFVQNPERLEPVSVRLHRPDEVYCTRLHSLYSSRELAFAFGRSIQKREACMPTGGAATGDDELPRQMVEAAPQIVSGVSGDHREGGRDWLLNPHPVDEFTGMRVLIAPEAVWVALAKDLDLRFKVADVVFGPFDFCPDLG
jgi:hypothetical protein